jgi:hypothetical protein
VALFYIYGLFVIEIQAIYPPTKDYFDFSPKREVLSSDRAELLISPITIPRTFSGVCKNNLK